MTPSALTLIREAYPDPVRRGRAIALWTIGGAAAGGVSKDAAFAEAGDEVDDRIDAAYRTKCGRYRAYVAPMVAPTARETTLKLVPR